MVDRLEFLKRALMAPIAAVAGVRMAKAEEPEPEQVLIGPADMSHIYTPGGGPLMRSGDSYQAQWGPHRFSGQDVEVEVVREVLDASTEDHRRYYTQGLMSATVTLKGASGGFMPVGECHTLKIQIKGRMEWYELEGACLIAVQTAATTDGPPIGSTLEFRGGEMTRIM